MNPLDLVRYFNSLPTEHCRFLIQTIHNFDALSNAKVCLQPQQLRSSRPPIAGLARSANMLESNLSAPVAQLDRASGYEPEGREFESLRAHHFPITDSITYKNIFESLLAGFLSAC